MIKSSGTDEIQAEIHQVRFHVADNQGFLQKLREIGKENKCTLICFNRDTIAGRRHVETALRFACRSFNSDSPISRSIEVEALLYAAGTRQTGLIGSFGIHPGNNECYLGILPPIQDAEKILHRFITFVDDEDWDDLSKKKIDHLLKLFEISKEEIQVIGNERVTDLILERVALLNVNR